MTPLKPVTDSKKPTTQQRDEAQKEAHKIRSALLLVAILSMTAFYNVVEDMSKVEPNQPLLMLKSDTLVSRFASIVSGIIDTGFTIAAFVQVGKHSPRCGIFFLDLEGSLGLLPSCSRHISAAG